MKKYEKILSMDQKCIINMVKNFNEKSQLYNYIRNVIVDDGKKKMLETFGYMELEEVLLLLLLFIIIYYYYYYYYCNLSAK